MRQDIILIVICFHYISLHGVHFLHTQRLLFIDAIDVTFKRSIYLAEVISNLFFSWNVDYIIIASLVVGCNCSTILSSLSSNYHY